MKRQLARELEGKIGETVKIQGWVHRIRNLGGIAFILLRDRSGVVQCVVDTKEIDIKGLKLESVVEIIGRVKEESRVELGLEILVQELKVISKVVEDLPIEINNEELKANLDTVLNHRVLSLRNLKTNAIFKVQAALAQGFAAFLKKEGFTQIFTPKIVATGTEGGTELFQVQYFDKKAYLAQSPQFYKQMLVGAGYERVFEIGHVYRAETHDTSRHTNEFISLDLEMGFIEDERDVMALETRMLKEIFAFIKEECARELDLLEVEVPEIGDEIPSIKFPEALEILRQEYGKEDLKMDLDPEGERLIAKYVKERYGSEFVFITHYPQAKRPMYTMPAEDGLTHSFDLLFRGLEITTGGQRIHDYEQLKASIISRGLSVESFSDYLEVFKFGMPPHGGLAIGLERLTGQLLGYKNIRQTTLFPRDRYRIRP
ncbi:aspartate--tRNA(Asn) ligase [Anoxybacter fermentans]|uniref:Aspartate--tRNA ligase n=1 Tax=Anoxybacter fermentans TaxID=1323375 RepID=A0A3S9T1U9_9FIRM|nr:aspartate--tRNA(Asn) ligase [Anoxybacter fermentans]AZR74487.1 aspartate--tRNA(Asn) ligase [Anoxybacter fermentans]